LTDATARVHHTDSWLDCVAGGRTRAQPIPVVGYLSPQTPGEGSQSLNNFRDGLKQTGFIEGGNLTI
jgi:hypothetical protein